MKKNYFTLFLLLSISNPTFAKMNLFCKNLDTADTECIRIAKEMYETRTDNLANAFVKTQEKKGKIVDKQKALYAMKKMQSIEEFMKSFKLCGEFSKTQEKAKLCLDSTFMSATKKSNGKISTPHPKQSASNTIIKTETQFETKPLSQDLKEYITKTHKPVKNKKIVIYPNVTPNCPYGQLFMQTLNKQKNRTDFQKSYSFRPLAINPNANYSSVEEANVVINFLNSCGIMCIANLENNWIYSIGNAVGAEEANILPRLFSALKSK